MKNFKGKAIYNPSGKAGEYSYWACNFYVGCSNGCTYCYCKKGILATAMGQDKPQLKKCFKDEAHALEVFEKELLQNIDELRKHGLFFSFTTDPMLPETSKLTWKAAVLASENKVPVKFLTKKIDWVEPYLRYYTQLTAKKYMKVDKQFYAFGFTLTGHDELEPNASTNAERIEAMRKLHDAGFKTFVSFEPMLNDRYVINTLDKYNQFIDLAKIGLESGCGKIKYLYEFIEDILAIEGMKTKIYFKDSLLKQAGITRADLPDNCVSRDYSIFNIEQP